MMMNRRTFSTTLLTGAAASLISARGMAVNATPEKARNVVLVHGLSHTQAADRADALASRPSGLPAAAAGAGASRMQYATPGRAHPRPNGDRDSS